MKAFKLFTGKLFTGLFFFGALCFFNAGAYAAQSDEPLGDLRLFLSSDQRAQLDEMRRNSVKNPVPKVVVEKSIPKVAKKKRVKPEPVMPNVTLQGYVTRSDGENTVWINNQATIEGQTTGQKLQALMDEKLLVRGKQKVCYNEQLCKKLAKDDPKRAIVNAESYACFTKDVNKKNARREL